MDSTLKQGPKRTILVEHSPGQRRVVKRFHSPGALDGIKDGLRAWREYRALRWLRRRGLPVPRPLAVRRRSGSWELVQEELTHCRPLALLLGGTEPWGVEPKLVAHALGRLLADLWAARIWHPDLHMGNVLVGPQGDVFLVDLARVRTRWTRDLGEFLLPLAAGTREVASPWFRARVLRALSHTVAEARSLLANEEFELKARQLRRADVRKRLVRYHRVSGAMAEVEGGGGLVRKDLTEHAQGVAALDPTSGWIQSPWDPEREVEVLVGAMTGPRLKRWNTAAHLESHAIASERPVAWLQGSRERIVFDRPRGCRPLAQAWAAWSLEQRERAAWTAGSLWGALQDRGLEPGNTIEVLAVEPELLLLRLISPVDQETLQPNHCLQQWTASVGDAPRALTEIWCRSFAAALRGTRTERQNIHKRLVAQVHSGE